MSQTFAEPSLNENRSRQFVSPYYLLRVGGLPLDVVDELVFEETLRWAEEVCALEGELGGGREGLLETLHTEVRKRADEPQLQRSLLALKRDIFNLRPPKNPAKAAEAIALLGPGVREAAEAWLRRIEERRVLQADGEAVLRRELESKRGRLKSILRDESFCMGLLLASPSLERNLHHYFAAPDSNPNRRLRLAERSGLLYLFRTACKTSPFSTLGAVSSGRLDRPSPPLAAAGPGRRGRMDKKSFVRVNVTFLSNLSSLILADEAMLRELPLSMKDGWEIREDRVRYVRRTVDTSGLGKKVQQSVTESIFYLPLSPTLRGLIEVLGGGGERTLPELISALVREVAGDAEQVEEFLRHLLRLDFLTARDLQLSLHSDSTLADYRGRLAKLRNPTARELCAHLENMERLIGAYAPASLDERRRLLAEIEAEMSACHAALGREDEPVSEVLLYEDTTVSPPLPRPGPADWRDQAEGLKEIQQLLPIFDASLRSRLVMNAFFKIIYGEGQRCDDVVSFAEIFVQDYFKEYRRAAMMDGQADAEGNLTPSVNHFDVPAISRLDSLRQDFAEFLSMELLALPPGSTELRISRESLRGFTSRVPGELGGPFSRCFFSQAALTDDGVRLVINRVYSGFTEMYSRFLYPFEHHGAQVGAEDMRGALARVEPPGAVFASMQGSYDTNLNIHPLVTRYQLVCPGEQSSRPVDEQIRLDDLYIEHDRSADVLRLRSRRLGKDVMPLYLGFLLPMALPQIRQVLINFSPYTMAMLYPWAGVKSGPKVGNTFAYYPRISYESIVLQRAMWKIAAEFLPRRAPSQGDADYFLTVKRWREQCGIPRRVFMTPDGMAPAEKESGEEPEGEGRRGRGAEAMMTKPMFVDFDSFFSVQLFEQIISKSSSRVVLTEMLPGRDEQWLGCGDHRYVTEFIFEIYQERGGAA